MQHAELLAGRSTNHLISVFFFYKEFLSCVSLLKFWGFRVVLQQNERFSEIEEKYKFLHGRTSSLFDMEEEVLKVSKKVRFKVELLVDGTLKGQFNKL